QDALAKFKYGTGEAKYGQKHVVNVEKMEETDPEIISSQIEAKYGYHPEDLKSGNVKGLKGKWASWKFRIKDRLAHVAGISSQYDQYRQALTLTPPSLELKRKEEVMDVEDDEFEVVEETRNIPTPPAHLQKEYVLESPMTITQAQRYIPQADKLWELANKKVTEKPAAAVEIMKVGERDLRHNDAATTYVLAVAKYIRALEQTDDDKTLLKLRKTVDNFSNKLGLEGNSEIQKLMTRRPKTREVTRNVRSRQAVVKQRERRWRF
ncbi:MAG: hypothetical protein ABH820_01610, partial [Patescibacteria group bacterium]